MSIKSWGGKLLDWTGLANVPAALEALSNLKGEGGKLVGISAVDASGVATGFEAIEMPSGTDSGDYADLNNKPSINGVELDGNKTTADLGIEGATDEQVTAAVSKYMEANPVKTDAWPEIVPTLNAQFVTNTGTNERSVRGKSVQLNASGTTAHNLAMVKLTGNYVFATWAEYTSVDNANGGGQCFQRWAVLKITSNEVIGNWTAAEATFGAEIVASGTLYEGATVTAGAISDASDACIFRLSDTKLAVMSKVTISGSSTPYSCTAVIEFDAAYTPTITYHEPTINGGAWDMSGINSAYPEWVQFNSEPVLAGASWYIAMAISGMGVQVMSTTDGIDFAPAYFVPCEHVYIEAALAMTAANKFFLAMRSGYGDGALYLACGTVATDGTVTVNGQRRILGCGSSRPHIVKTSTQGPGGSTANMPFFVVCTDANRRNGHIYRVRTYGNYGSGPIVSADEICAWGQFATYPVHLDLGGFNNISNVMGCRRQLLGATDAVGSTISVYPISCVGEISTVSYRDGADWAEAPTMSGYIGAVYVDGAWAAYNPLVQTIADKARATKLSAYLQHYAGKAEVISTPGVLAHESSIGAPGVATWVENVDGTAKDVPTIDGVTAVKARFMGGVYSFPKVGDIWEPETDAVIVAQQGDEAIDSVTGETFVIQGGVGYQTFVNNAHVLCGYVPSYNQLRGMTVPVSYGSDGTATWKVLVGERKTWTLTIDGEMGEYVYTRLAAPANTAVLHPSNQVAKIGSTYYRADVVPTDGFVVCSSTDLINWTYVAHVSLPDGFTSNGLYEVCLGVKNSRLYAAIRQQGASNALYLCKLSNDFKTVNSIVTLPDCSSKPYFVGLDNSNLLLATAPVDRYSCLVYNILDTYNIVKILPVFEVVGTACNYPHIATVGVDPALLAIIGTNGAQADLNGVSALPCMVYWANLIKRVISPSDIMLHDAEKAVAWGNIYELPVFPYTVTNTLTNVTTSNEAAEVAAHREYTATLTAADGYTLGTVTVTMGGSDVTTNVYADGVVTIDMVTGDIVVTATATAAE